MKNDKSHASSVCPHCHYSITRGHSNCPVCGLPVSDGSNALLFIVLLAFIIGAVYVFFHI
ncbi:MAG: hypothetical protein ABJA67_02780 [Chthonomonadales bacterium]